MMNDNIANILTNTSIILDTTTKDYVNLNGQIANGNSLQCRIYQALKTPKSQWLYAPSKRYGSDFYKLENSRQIRNKTEVGQITLEALGLLVNSGDLVIKSLSIPVFTPGTININIEGVDAQGEGIKYIVNPLV